MTAKPGHIWIVWLSRKYQHWMEKGIVQHVKPWGSKPLLAFPFLGGISHLCRKRFKAFLLCLIKAHTMQNDWLDVTKYHVCFLLPLLPLSVNASITTNKEFNQSTNVPETYGQWNRTSQLLFQKYLESETFNLRWRKTEIARFISDVFQALYQNAWVRKPKHPQQLYGPSIPV